MDEFLDFICPHCDCHLVVHRNEINCSIFRHAVYKHNMQQINPHESKENCDKLIQEDKVFGCGKPFKIITEENKYQIIICDYI